MTDRELLDDLLNGCVMAKGQGKRSDNTYILEEMIEIIRTRLAQPEPEPVAWMEIENYLDEENLWDERKVLLEYDNGKSVPLYIAPPNKEWAGLTDEEIHNIEQECDQKFEDYFEFANAIEAKLKEKNT